MRRLRLALAITFGYIIAFYAGAAFAFLLPFGSAAYSAIDAGAQALAILFGISY